jgi:GH15 family glucan-1,4-alpha-glucosidase
MFGVCAFHSDPGPADRGSSFSSGAEALAAMPGRIEDYALVGDCETAALIHRDGSVDWLCWPRFDSGAIFAALLGNSDNGRWLLSAAEPNCRVTRRYRSDTLILETEIEGVAGSVTVIDFMPPRGQASDLVRLVMGRSGRLAMSTKLTFRFDYGEVIPWVTRDDAGELRAVAGPDMVVLRTPVPLRGENMHTVGEFDVAAGETAAFVLSYGSSHMPPPAPIDALAALKDTENFWRDWTARSTLGGEYADVIKRSIITLKALTYRPTGGIVAAPTTSLPEMLGGSRNWDYRFCWLRDATFTLLALMNAGYYDDAENRRRWLARAIAGAPQQLQIMYGIGGERRLTEWIAGWLEGYEGARPVRIGNAAHEQIQLDVYGEVMDALFHARLGGLAADEASWNIQLKLLEHLETIWTEPDEGIWEVRGGPRQFVHSKVMAWVAFDRACKMVEQFDMKGPYDRWAALRDVIHREVCAKGFDSDIGAFTQSYGSKHLDASALLIPLIGFLPPDDPRVLATVAAIERHLTFDGLVLRYDTRFSDDGLPPGEGVFLPCSFWLAHVYMLQGRDEDARQLFRRLVGLCNDLGLLSEEYDPGEKRALGNFPQAFSHIALVYAGLALAKAPVGAQRHDVNAGERPPAPKPR